jgi:hypothetical protein
MKLNTTDVQAEISRIVIEATDKAYDYVVASWKKNEFPGDPECPYEVITPHAVILAVKQHKIVAWTVEVRMKGGPYVRVAKTCDTKIETATGDLMCCHLITVVQQRGRSMVVSLFNGRWQKS